MLKGLNRRHQAQWAHLLEPAKVYTLLALDSRVDLEDVVVKAVKLANQLRRDAPPPALNPILLSTTDAQLLHFALCQTIDRLEKRMTVDAAKGLCEPPSRQAVVGRYVRFLLWITMRFPSDHRAIAFGTLLHRFTPSQVEVATEGLPLNAPRTRKELLKKIRSHFRAAIEDAQTTEPATLADREAIRATALEFLAFPHFVHAPQTLPHPAHALRHLNPASSPAACPRKRDPVLHHLFACQEDTCGGIAAVVRSYNARPGVERLPDPDDRLHVPTFRYVAPSPPPQASASGVEDPMTSNEIERRVHAELATHRRCQRRFCGDAVRIRVDGADTLRLPLRECGSDTFEIGPFDSVLEVVADDDELLLAALMLPDIDALGAGERVVRRLPRLGRTGMKIVLTITGAANADSTCLARVDIAHADFAARLRGVLSTFVRASWSESESVGPHIRALAFASSFAAVVFAGIGIYLFAETRRLERTIDQLSLGLVTIGDPVGDRVLADYRTTVRAETTARLDAIAGRLARQAPGTFERLMNGAKALVYGGRLDAAVDTLQRAKEMRPEQGEPYKLLAAAFKLQGNHAASIKVLREWLERQPTDAEGWNYIGWSYFMNGDAPNARHAYETALSYRAGDYADARLNLGLLERAEGHEVEARVLLDAATARLEREVIEAPLNVVAHFALAKIHAHEQRWEQAVEYLDVAVRTDPEWAFWARHEPFFNELARRYPDVARRIDVLADLLAGRRVRGLLATL